MINAVYLASWGGCDATAAPAMSYCAGVGAHIWNFSHTSSSGDNWLFDYWATHSPYVLTVAASGNKATSEQVSCGTTCPSARQTVTSANWNGLVVGGSNDCSTSTRTDDDIWCQARDLNVSNRELPHLVAPAQNLWTDGSSASGTSVAAPAVASAAAQILEKNGLLLAWPEILRSILMAGANETVSGGTLSLHDGVDDRDGAGELSVRRSLLIADSGNKRNGGNTPADTGYDYGTINTSSAPEGSFYSEVYKARTSSTSSGRLRVVLSWDRIVTCPSPSLSSSGCNGAAADDFDLYVYDSSGTLVAVSGSAYDTYEFVEFNASTNEIYDIKIKAYDWNNTSTSFGLAWYMSTAYTTN